MNLSEKIKKIGFPIPILPDVESRTLHENLIKENWTYRKQPDPKPSLKSKVGRIEQSSRNFVLGFSSVTHLLKRTTTGAFIDDINYFVNQGFEDSIIHILADQELPTSPGNWVEEDIPNWNALSIEER